MYLRPGGAAPVTVSPSDVERPLLGHLFGTRPSDISAVCDRSDAPPSRRIRPTANPTRPPGNGAAVRPARRSARPPAPTGVPLQDPGRFTMRIGDAARVGHAVVGSHIDRYGHLRWNRAGPRFRHAQWVDRRRCCSNENTDSVRLTADASRSADRRPCVARKRCRRRNYRRVGDDRAGQRAVDLWRRVSATRSCSGGRSVHEDNGRRSR
jgi:hypothetical protein